MRRSSNRLTRRQVIYTAVVAPFGAALLTACGAGGVATTTSATASATATSPSTAKATTTAIPTSSATSAASNGAAAATTAASTAAATQAPVRGAGTVDLWLLGDEAWFKPMVDTFNKSQSQVNVQWQPRGDIAGQTGLVAAEASGSPPNLAITYDEVAVGFAGKQMIQPMDTMLSQLKLTREQFQPAAIDGITWNGKLWGMPVDWDPDFMLYYNPDLFQQAGLDPDKPPTTLEELASIAPKLDASSNGAFTRIGFAPWNGWGFYPIAFSYLHGGKGIYDAQTKQPTLNSPTMVEGMSWVADWAKRYNPTIVTQVSKGSSKAGPFGDSRLGMLAIGDWELQTLHNAASKNFRFRIVPFPPPEAHKDDYHLSASGWIWVLPNGVKNLDATATVLGWLAADKQMLEWCQNIGWLPARVKLLDDPTYQTADWQPFIKALKTLPLYPEIQPTPDAATIEVAMRGAASKILELKNSPQEVLDSAQTALVAQIKAQG